MPAVAEVQFKAQGSQQVVTAFNSVGSAAQTSSTKVQQNSTAMSSMGKSMKSSVASIGQVTTAFATLSLSIVNTYRSYRDLGDAQLAVDKATKKLHATELAIKNLKADIAKDQKAQSKGGLDYAIVQAKISKQAEDYHKHQKDGKHTTAELRLEYLNLQKAQKEAGKGSEELTAKQEKLKVMEEGLTNIKTGLGEAQERYNDIQQNFYLSIVPTAISSIGLLTTAFSGLKGTLTGGGGLLGGLGPIALILGGISLAVLAFQTNFLGLRDAVGGVIQWLKDRFGVWKQTIEDVFNLIRKGDWGAVFNKIKDAAVAFWADLKKSVPFFGEVEKLVEKIRGGNWKGAFLQIWKAASDAWATIKKNIPILGKIEDFLAGIAAGDWKGTFKTIAEAIKTAFNETLGKGIEWVFGANWKLGLDAWLKLQEAEATINKRPLILQYAIAINATIESLTGIDIGKWLKEHPITAASINMPLSGITMSIEDPQFQAALTKGAEIILGALGTALSAAAKILDPYFAAAVKALNFNTAITAAKDAIVNAGQAIWIHIFNGIRDGFGGQDWGQLFAKFPAAVDEAWKANAPETQKAIFENWKNSWLAAQLGMSDMTFPVKPEVSKDTPTIIQNGLNARGSGGYKVPTQIDPASKTKMATDLTKLRTDIGKKPALLKVDTDTKLGLQRAKILQSTINNMKATIKVNAQVGTTKGLTAGVHLKQHGYQSTVHRPTMFIAGEGGRPEDVTVRPRGSVQRGGSAGGGGFNGTINVYVDGVLRPARYDMGARK